MKVDGSNMRQIVHGADAPSWSPTGREIAYLRDGGVCYSGPFGGGQRVVSPGYDYVGTLDWSPDGRRLAFQEPALGGALVVAAKDRSTKVGLGRGGTPAFSPDGRQIAYGFYGEYDKRFRGRIFVMNADGQEKRVLVAGADPAWQRLQP
jgi:Tol biopolymer transport system component